MFAIKGLIINNFNKITLIDILIITRNKMLKEQKIDKHLLKIKAKI